MKDKADDYPVLRVRVTKEQHDKVYRLGGAKWVKEQIDNASEIDRVIDSKLIDAAPKLLKSLDDVQAAIYKLLSGLNSASEIKKLKQIRAQLENGIK